MVKRRGPPSQGWRTFLRNPDATRAHAIGLDDADRDGTGCHEIIGRCLGVHVSTSAALALDIVGLIAGRVAVVHVFQALEKS
jgi:hypothetical protein